MKTLKTQIHYYCFNTNKAEEKTAYLALCEKIKAQSPDRGRWMNALAMPGSRGMKEPTSGTQEIELETAHIFDNQWNGTTARVFDWYEGINPNSRHLKFGHWLTITPEMAKLRKDTLKCGYCGKLYGPHHAKKPKSAFCESCLGSQYLKREELHLLRLVPVCDDWKEGARYKLTEKESAALVPVWEEMRRTCDLKRASEARKKERASIVAELEAKKRELEKGNAGALEKHDGMLWLWEHGFTTDNWIYYSHTRTFALGWRDLADDETALRFLDVASEFPFNYEIRARNRELCKARKNEPVTH